MPPSVIGESGSNGTYPMFESPQREGSLMPDRPVPDTSATSWCLALGYTHRLPATGVHHILYPILDMKISIHAPPPSFVCYSHATPFPLDFETGWTVELWSKTNII